MEEKIKRSFSAKKEVRDFKRTLKEQSSNLFKFVKGMEFIRLKFTKWEKQLFEGGKESLSGKHKGRANGKSAREEKLEEKVEKARVSDKLVNRGEFEVKKTLGRFKEEMGRARHKERDSEVYIGRGKMIEIYRRIKEGKNGDTFSFQSR